MSDKKDTGTPIDLTERVEVWPTEKAPYHREEYEAGESTLCAPKVAEKMLKLGWATKTKQPAKGKGKGDDIL